MQSLWLSLVSSWSPRTLWTFTSLIHTIVFVVANAALFACHRYDLFHRYKIQQHKYPSDELIKRCLKDVAIKHLVGPILLLLLWPLAEWTGVHATPDLPSYAEVTYLH